MNYSTADGTATAGNNDYSPDQRHAVLCAGRDVEDDHRAGRRQALRDAVEFLRGPFACGQRHRHPLARHGLDRAAFPCALTVGDAAVLAPDSGSTCAAFSINLSVPSTQPVTVSFTTVDRTAVAGIDYTAMSGTVTFAPGETTKTVCVPLLAVGSGRADEGLRADPVEPRRRDPREEPGRVRALRSIESRCPRAPTSSSTT